MFKFLRNLILMGAVLIQSSVDETGAAGLGYQNHLIGALNDNTGAGAWWVFYTVGTATTLSTKRSIDNGATWAAKAASNALLVGNNGTDGRSFGCAYQSIAGADVVHIDCSDSDGSTAWQTDHTRFRPDTNTWAAWVRTGAAAVTSQNAPQGITPCIDANQRPIANLEWGGGVGSDGGVARATNTDAGSSWTSGMGTVQVIDSTTTNSVNGSCIFAMGGNDIIVLQENGAAAETSSMTNVRHRSFTAGAWAANVGNVFASNFTAAPPADFGAVDVSTTDIHCVARTGASAYTHRRCSAPGNPATWNNGDSIPAKASTSGLGLVMITDGTSVWLFSADNASQTINYIKWISGTGWVNPVDGTSTWAQALSFAAIGSGTIGSLSGWNRVFNNTAGVIFGAVNASHTDLYFLGTAVATPIAVDEGDPLLYAFRTIWCSAKRFWHWLFPVPALGDAL